MTAGKTQQMSFSGGCFCQIEIAAVEGKELVIEERFDPDRTILTLKFVEKEIDKENKRRKQAKKASEENRRRKTEDHIRKMKDYLEQNGGFKTKEIVADIEPVPAWIRA